MAEVDAEGAEQDVTQATIDKMSELRGDLL
eukprot:SAG31_NODE_12205_length_959_cov_0.995349_1_plen_29_part_10